MNYDDALQIATEVKAALSPVSERIEIVGSIRRRRIEVRDVDILLIPSKDKISFQETIAELFGLLTADGEKIKRGTVSRLDKPDVQVDLYLADAKTWSTLMLIRTGSAASNVRLTSIAKSKGWKLHASGLGLTNERNDVIANDERSIFETLGVTYLKPEDRDADRYMGAWNTLKGVAQPHD